MAAIVSVFQRTPHWISPNRDCYRSVEKGLIWALNYIPHYAEWRRARMIFSFADRTWPSVNDDMRETLTAYISEQLRDCAALVPKCVPSFPVFGKRLVVDNNWYGTLARDNVDLVTEGIARITRQGIETIDGRLHELDVIVVATGFKSNLFLSPMEVVGPSGTNLEQVLMIRKE